MKKDKIQFLGFSKSKAILLQDMLDEKYLMDPLTFVLNIDVNTDIDFYTQEFPYQILSPGTILDPQSKYSFAICGPKNKQAVFKYFKKQSNISENDFINIIDSTAAIAKSTIVHSGCMIQSLVSISSQTEIKFGVDIKRGVQIGHHNRIGQFTDINPGAILCGYVTIGENCSIGAGSVIRDGITIGKNSIIGMGSVVTKDIPEGVVAYGNPCKIVR